MRLVGGVLFLLLAAFFVACYCVGVFDEVAMTAGERGPFFLIYREHVGPYREVKFVKTEVARYLAGRHETIPARGFARFLDNPQKVQPENLRSIVGYITDSILSGVTTPYKTDIFLQTRCVSGVFSIRSHFSQFIGALKFYPRLFRYCRREKLEMAGPVLEIYDGAGKRIEYIAPIK
jgi:hypothetical protein